MFGRYDIAKTCDGWIVLDTMNRYMIIQRFATRGQAAAWVRNTEGR